MDFSQGEYSKRILRIALCFIAIGTIISVRLFQVQILEHNSIEKKIDQKTTKTSLYTTGRGSIYTRDHVILAEDSPKYQLAIHVDQLSLKNGLVEEIEYTLYHKKRKFSAIYKKGVTPPRFKDTLLKIKKSTERLATEPSLLDISHQTDIELNKLINEIQKCFVRCLRQWAYLGDEQILDIYLSQHQAYHILQNSDRYPGFSCIQSSTRYYPKKELASHLIGYIGPLNDKQYRIIRMIGHYPNNPDAIRPITLTQLEAKHLNTVCNYHIGVTGVEYIFNQRLRGKLNIYSKNSKYTQVDHVNHMKNNSLYLTIDSELQAQASKLLNGQQGAIILFDLQKGDVLCAVSVPNFDPNLLSPPKKINYHNYLKEKPGRLVNRCFEGTYPFGSIFKIVTAAAVLEEGIASPETTYYCSQTHPKTKLKCLGYHSHISVENALERSCNVYFYESSLKLGIVKLYNWSRKFYLGQPLQIGFPYEKGGIIPNRNVKRKFSNEIWYPGDTCHTAIGQGYQSGTPLQAAIVSGLIAKRDGIKKPRFWFKKDNEILKVKLNPEVRQAIKKGMWKVVNRPKGTAYNSKSSLIEYAGKTGTADVHKKEPHAWFSGFAPYKNPRVAISVIVENAGHGGDVAAPIAKIILESWARKYYLNHN